jgi:hypothetical protein
VVNTLERLVDATTACAVHLDDSGHLSAEDREQLAALLGELERDRERTGLELPELPLAV